MPEALTAADPSVYSTYGSHFDSPDNDSAFSSESGGGPPSSSSSSGGPAQDQQQPQQFFHSSPPSSSSASYAQGRDVAGGAVLLGEPEVVAPRRTLYVKIFCGDGSTKSVMINETMSIAYVLSVLVEKNHVQPDPSWGIVEQIPELYLERCYEDHECLVENLLDWRSDSPNKILFLSRPEKYDLFRRPERYLVSSPSIGVEPAQVKSGCTGGKEYLVSGGRSGGSGGTTIGNSLNTTWDQLSRQNLLQEFFSRAAEDYYPEIEGMLWIKMEGKKSWKKNYFALRADGIYQRGGKLLASICDHQVYKAIGWKKKFKAPNDFGFALKHPSIQVKDEVKDIKYLCAESESSLLKWLTGLRIVKNKDFLLDNYQNQLAEMTTGHCIARENRVVIAINKEEPLPPQPSHQPHQPPPTSRSNRNPRVQHLHPSSNDTVYSPSSTTSSSNSSERDLPQPQGREFLLSNSASKSQSAQISMESLSSSGCVSESSSLLSENGGFETDYHNGGTIRRKPAPKVIPPPRSSTTQQDTSLIYASEGSTPLLGTVEDEDDEEFVLPPPPMPDLSIVGRFEREEHVRGGSIPNSSSNSSLPLPPPPNEPEAAFYSTQYYPQQYIHQVAPPQGGIYNANVIYSQQGTEGQETDASLQNGASCIREELYPCGVVRCLFPNRIAGGTPKKNQMDLLKRLPNQVPPPPAPNYSPPILKTGRKKRITFNEMVQNFNLETSESVLTPLKDNDPGFKVPSASVRNPNPGKLFGENHVIKGTPPKEFLHDLQRVMYKKWTVAQKISFPTATTEEEDRHNGFREPGFSNYNENAVSHWILQSLKHCQINDNEETLLPVEVEDLPPPPPSLLFPAAAPFAGGKKAFPHRTVPNTFPPRPEDRPFLLCQMRASGQVPPEVGSSPVHNNNVYYSSGPKLQ